MIKHKEFPRSGNYKVVQINIGEEPHLAIGNRENFHKNILSDFLLSANIEHDKNFPKLQGSEYNVEGMGFLYVREERKTVRFFGESVDYRIGISPNHLERIAKYYPDWELQTRL